MRLTRRRLRKLIISEILEKDAPGGWVINQVDDQVAAIEPHIIRLADLARQEGEHEIARVTDKYLKALKRLVAKDAWEDRRAKWGY